MHAAVFRNEPIRRGLRRWLIELADGDWEVVMRRESAIPNISIEYGQREAKWVWLGTVFMLVYLSTPALGAQVRVIQGQMVRLKVDNVLTTENVVKGATIDFDVAEDVVVAGHVVIHKGDPARGRVVAIRGAGKRNAKDASVTFQFVSVRSVDSQEIPLRKTPDKPKKADSKANEIEANEPLLGYPERVIGAEKGKEYVAYVDVSVPVNVPDTPAIPPPLATVAPAQAMPANPSGGAQPTSTGGTIPATAAPSAPGATVSTPAVPEEPALVDFNSDPPGADILIDDALVGNTPVKLSVAAGHHLIQLRIAGYSSWTRTMVVEPGSYPSIRATLEKP
jgi:hypothetical protein